MSVVQSSVRALRERGPVVFAGHALRQLGDRLLIREAARDFRDRRERVHDLEGALGLAFGFAFEGVRIAPMQIPREIARLLREVETRRPRTVLEIGTANGGSLYLFCEAAAPDAHLVSVDLPGGLFGGGYEATREPLYASFARPEQQLDLLRADSHDSATKKRVEELVGGRGVDFLFIDGDHSREGVENDYLAYAPLVRSGGAIALHDVHPGPSSLVGGVPDFWDELKATVEHEEFVDSETQEGYGIGVVKI
jgi:predicted O-methyltransferase YrrM